MAGKASKEELGYGNMYGEIQFGHLNLAGFGGLEADTKSSVKLQAWDPLHYYTMDMDGKRPGWTTTRCPGVWQVKCGDNRRPDDVSIFMRAENGDVIIQAPNGRIRLQAQDIDIRAEGEDNKRGIVNIESNNSVKIKTGDFDVRASVGISMQTPFSIKMVADASMTMLSNFVEGLTSASSPISGGIRPPVNRASSLVYNIGSSYIT
jgi:hypothetical protein